MKVTFFSGVAVAAIAAKKAHATMLSEATSNDLEESELG